MMHKLLVCMILLGLAVGPVGCSTTKGFAPGKVARGGIKRGWLRRMVKRNTEPVMEATEKVATAFGTGAVIGLGMYLDGFKDPHAPEGSFAKEAYDGSMEP